MEKFEGTWLAFESENMDGLFEAFGTPAEVRERMSGAEHKHTLRQDGEFWCLKMAVGGHGKETRVKLGEEFEDISPAGDTYKGTIEWDGEGFVGKMKMGKKAIPTTVQRRIDGDVMSVSISAAGQKMVQKFKKE